MNIPCVLTLTKNPMMNLGWTELNNGTENAPFFVSSKAQTLADLIKEINKFDVDVTQVDKSDLFSKYVVLTKLLLLFPRLIVLIVNEDSSFKRILHRDGIAMKSSANLIDLIQSA